MRAHLGTPVRSRDDKDLGHIEWVLVDPGTRSVKSVGIRHGRIREHAIKVPLDELTVNPGMDSLMANIDEEQTHHLTHATARDESESRAGEAVAASTGGGVWPADTFVTKRRQPETVPLHSEFKDMVNMHDSDVVVLGEGSDVFTKNMQHVGEINQIRFDTHMGQLLSIEVKRGHLHHQEFELPGEYIAGIDEGSIYLSVDRDDVLQHIRRG
jgi:uncharacterized protein YrrD